MGGASSRNDHATPSAPFWCDHARAFFSRRRRYAGALRGGALLPLPRPGRICAKLLTHASGANHRLVSNERLEFPGDAILKVIVCEVLFRQYPDYLEGEPTRVKSVVVPRAHLRRGRFPGRWGSTSSSCSARGMGSAGRNPSSVLADAPESLIGDLPGRRHGGRQTLHPSPYRSGDRHDRRRLGGRELQEPASATAATPVRRDPDLSCCSTRSGLSTIPSASTSRPRSDAGKPMGPPRGARTRKTPEKSTQAAMNALEQIQGGSAVSIEPVRSSGHARAKRGPKQGCPRLSTMDVEQGARFPLSVYSI